jgi:hypothetical protein
VTTRPLNWCSSCRSDFASLRLFDLHRVGKFPQTGPADYRDRLRAGVVDPEKDWRPTVRFGRRCLDEDEMTAKGWAKDARGRWADPAASERTQRAFQNAPSELHLTIRKAA